MAVQHCVPDQQLVLRQGQQRDRQHGGYRSPGAALQATSLTRSPFPAVRACAMPRACVRHAPCVCRSTCSTHRLCRARPQCAWGLLLLYRLVRLDLRTAVDHCGVRLSSEHRHLPQRRRQHQRLQHRAPQGQRAVPPDNRCERHQRHRLHKHHPAGLRHACRRGAREFLTVGARSPCGLPRLWRSLTRGACKRASEQAGGRAAVLHSCVCSAHVSAESLLLRCLLLCLQPVIFLTIAYNGSSTNEVQLSAWSSITGERVGTTALRVAGLDVSGPDT